MVRTHYDTADTISSVFIGQDASVFLCRARVGAMDAQLLQAQSQPPASETAGASELHQTPPEFPLPQLSPQL